MYIFRRTSFDRVCQGDIYRDIEIKSALKVIESNGQDEFEFEAVKYNYAVVLTQECDLEQDHNNRKESGDKHDKFIPSVLLAPAYLAEQLRLGAHLEELGLNMEKINTSRWKTIRQNDNVRYHFLPKNISFSVPDLVIDFKHYFTMLRDQLYEILKEDEYYVASLADLFREDLSHRFTYYLSRIGLPKIKPAMQKDMDA